MGSQTVYEIRECAGEITTKVSARMAWLKESRKSSEETETRTLELKPLDSRATFNRFMGRVMDLVNSGCPRLAFQEVDDAISTKRFKLSSQEEALVLMREGLRSITAGGHHPVLTSYELVDQGAKLRTDFGLHASGENGKSAPMLPVYGNTQRLSAPAMSYLIAA